MEDPFQMIKQQNQVTIKSSRFKKLGWLLIGGGVFFILLFSSLFYWWYQFDTTDNLIKLVPVDSVFYFSLKDAGPFGQKNLALMLPPQPFFKNLNINDELWQKAKSFALISFPTASASTTQEFNLVYLFELKTLPASNSLVSSKKYLILPNNFLVLADSDAALVKVKQVYNHEIFSLANQIDDKNFKNWPVHFFISKNNLIKFLNQNNNGLNTIFTHLMADDLYLSARARDQGWQFEFSGRNWPVGESTPSVEFLPQNFIFYASGINLWAIFNQLKDSEPAVFDFWQGLVSFSQEVYQFDLETLSQNLFQRPANLIIFNGESQNENRYHYILIQPLAESKLADDFRQAISIVLAQILPTEKPKRLADGTFVTELLAQAQAWPWQKEINPQGLEINYLNIPPWNLEINYLIKDHYLFISSSRSYLNNFLTDFSLAVVDLKKNCSLGGFNQPKNLIIINGLGLPEALKPYFFPDLTFLGLFKGKTSGCNFVLE